MTGEIKKYHKIREISVDETSCKALIKTNSENTYKDGVIKKSPTKNYREQGFSEAMDKNFDPIPF